MKKFKFVPFLLAAILSFGLFITGCSKDDRIKIELLTWHMSETSKFYAGYEKIAEEYEKTHKDVDIVIRSEPESSYNSILETSFTGNTASEIVQLKTTERTRFSSYLMDLTPYFEKENPYDKRNSKWMDNFEDGFQKESVGSEGKTGYAYVPHDTNPYVASGRFWVYNKDLAKKAGCDLTKPPNDWKEMFEWCIKMQEYANKDSKDKLVAAIAGNKDVAAKVTPIANEMGPIVAEAFFNDGTELGNAIIDINNASSLFNFTRTILTSIPNSQKAKLIAEYPELFATGMHEAVSENGVEVRPKSKDTSVGVVAYMPYYAAMMKLQRLFVKDYFDASWIENESAQEMLAFASGQAVMMSAFSWNYAPINEQVQGSKNFPEGVGAFPTPYFGADTLSYAVDKGWITQAEADAAAPFVTKSLSNSVAGRHEYGFSINESLKNNPEKLAKTVDFMQFLTSKESQQTYVNIAGSSSPVKGVNQPESSEIFKLTPPEGGFNLKKMMGPVVYEWSNDWGPEMYNYIYDQGAYTAAGGDDWQTFLTKKATDLHRNRFVPLKSVCEEIVAKIKSEKPTDYIKDVEYLKHQMFLDYYYADGALVKLQNNWKAYIASLS